jgi:nucleoside-diphosphate-sugar epimerase
VTGKGTENLLRAALEAGVVRIVFSSSTRVLEASDTGYARSKRRAERLLAETPISTASLRLPPVYGLTRRGFVAELLAKAAAGRLPPFPDFGDRRSLIHLDDAIQALLLAAQDPGLTGNWTVTDLQEYSMRRIVEAIHEALNRPTGKPWPKPAFSAGALAGELLQRLLGKSMPLNLERLGKLRHSSWYDGTPFANATGFLPLYSLERALPEMAAKLAQAIDDAS